MLQKQYSCTLKFRCALLPPGFLLELFVSVSLILFVLHLLRLVVHLSFCLNANHINYTSPLISAFVIVAFVPLHPYTVQGSEIVESPECVVPG